MTVNDGCENKTLFFFKIPTLNAAIETLMKEKTDG